MKHGTEGNYLQKELSDLIRKDPSIFEFIQNSSLDGVWYWDLENPENEWMNAKFWTTMGYDPDEMPHQPSSWQNIIFEDDLVVALENLKLHLDNPDHPYDQTVRYRHKNGSTIWIQCRGMIIRKDGKAVRMIGAHHDVTRLKKAEQELISKNEEYRSLIAKLEEAKLKAEESDRLKTAFLRNISHEIRTPLNSIVGFTSVISENHPGPQKMKVFSDMISESSNKLLDIISDVLELSRFHSNQIEVTSSECDIVEIVSSVVDSYREKAREKSIMLKFNPVISEALVISDCSRIKSICKHLIDNAIKFTLAGNVDVVCNVDDDEFELIVSDTGIGISGNMHQSVFLPFLQAEDLPEKKYDGVGIGLAIVKSNVEILNGSITLDSAESKGTRIAIRIPVSRSAASKPLNSADDKQFVKPGSDINTILVAEDEFINYVFLYELLNSGNVKVIHAVNGQTAVEMCRDNKDIDLILMDLKMPVMDGGTAARKIKEFRSDLPIIAQTAYTMESEHYQDVFDDFLTKPIRAEVLRQTLKKFITI